MYKALADKPPSHVRTIPMVLNTVVVYHGATRDGQIRVHLAMDSARDADPGENRSRLSNINKLLFKVAKVKVMARAKAKASRRAKRRSLLPCRLPRDHRQLPAGT